VKKIIVGAVAAAAVAITGSACSMMNNETHHNCKVLAKDVLQKVSGNKDGTSTHFERRLGTSCGTFVVEDSLNGGFNSYDTWTALQEGKVYDIETGGFRVGLFDSFPTVVKVTPK
jgi:hypothetical protein